MVHVQVEEKEFEAGIFAFEVSPTANAGQDCIPAFTRHVRSLRQPEIAFLYHIKFVGAVEDSGVFPLLFAIIAATPI